MNKKNNRFDNGETIFVNVVILIMALIGFGWGYWIVTH